MLDFIIRPTNRSCYHNRTSQRIFLWAYVWKQYNVLKRADRPKIPLPCVLYTVILYENGSIHIKLIILYACWILSNVHLLEIILTYHILLILLLLNILFFTAHDCFFSNVCNASWKSESFHEVFEWALKKSALSIESSIFWYDTHLECTYSHYTCKYS